MSGLPFLTLLVVMVTASAQSPDDCLRLLREDGTENDVTSDLMFLPEPNSARIICARGQQNLRCCAHNFQSLQWHHYNATSKTWAEVELSSYVYYSPEGDPRTLVLEQTALSDSGWYRCTATDGQGHRISHNVSLVVEVCPLEEQQPVLSLVPEGNLYLEPGDDLNLTCHIYYGANFAFDMVAQLFWLRTTAWENGSLAGHDVWVPGAGIYPSDPRIQLDVSNQLDRQESVLTVHGVMTSDFGNYSCRAINSLAWSEVKMVSILHVEPGLRDITPDTIGPIAARALGVAVGVAVVATLLGLYWRKDILLLYKDNFAKPRKPDALYDAIIIYNEAHNPDCLFVVEDLLPVLEGRFGYRLCIAQRDFIAGPDLGDVILDSIASSQALVFVVTEAMLQQEWCDFVFQYVVAQEYTNLVFIMREPIREEAWHTDQAPLRKVLDASKHVIRWPSETRKRKSFWTELRVSLPAKLRSRTQSENNSGTSTSSNSHGMIFV